MKLITTPCLHPLEEVGALGIRNHSQKIQSTFRQQSVVSAWCCALNDLTPQPLIPEDLWAFSTSTSTWAQLASGPSFRYFFGFASFSGALHVIGGDTYSARASWTYDPAEDEWANATSFDVVGLTNFVGSTNSDPWDSGFLLDVAGALHAVNNHHQGTAYARPFVGVFQKSVSMRCINFWRYFPTKTNKWLQERTRDTPSKGLLWSVSHGLVSHSPEFGRNPSSFGVETTSQPQWERARRCSAPATMHALQ